jgi:ABC-type branched-subunit amino acid transport system substrate-binding protein
LTGLPTDLFASTFKLPEGRNTTFSMLGPAVRVMRQSVETFINVGAKTVVAVANVRYDGYNRYSCFQTADLLAARGLNLMVKNTIEYTDGRERVKEIIKEIKALNPDVIIWCDWPACRLANDVAG